MCRGFLYGWTADNHRGGAIIAANKTEATKKIAASLGMDRAPHGLIIWKSKDGPGDAILGVKWLTDAMNEKLATGGARAIGGRIS